MVLIAGFWFSGSYVAGKKKQHTTYELANHELNMLQPGDIILRQGFGVVSHSIRNFLNEDFKVSHVALLSKNSPGQWQVIQSISKSLSGIDGVQTENLTDFVGESETNSVVVVRFRGFESEPELNLRIEQAALNYLQQQVPFDHGFSLDDSTSFFCSELIWRLFVNEAGVDIFEKMDREVRKERLRFASFFDPDYFEVIINHHNRQP